MTTPTVDKHSDPFELDLAQSGSACSGPSIRDCALHDRELTFTKTVRSGAVFRFKLELTDDARMEGTATVEWEGKVVDGVTTTVKLARE